MDLELEISYGLGNIKVKLTELTILIKQMGSHLAT